MVQRLYMVQSLTAPILSQSMNYFTTNAQVSYNFQVTKLVSLSLTSLSRLSEKCSNFELQTMGISTSHNSGSLTSGSLALWVHKFSVRLEGAGRDTGRWGDARGRMQKY